MGPRVVRVMTCQMGGAKYEPDAVGDGAGGNVRPPRKMLYDSRNTPDEFPGGAPSPQQIRDAKSDRKTDSDTLSFMTRSDDGDGWILSLVNQVTKRVSA